MRKAHSGELCGYSQHFLHPDDQVLFDVRPAGDSEGIQILSRYR